MADEPLFTCEMCGDPADVTTPDEWTLCRPCAHRRVLEEGTIPSPSPPPIITDCALCGQPADVAIELDAAYCPRCQTGWRIDGAAITERMKPDA